MCSALKDFRCFPPPPGLERRIQLDPVDFVFFSFFFLLHCVPKAPETRSFGMKTNGLPVPPVHSVGQ